MSQISDAMATEINRLLATRDLAAAARHLMELEPGADAVEFHCSFDKQGFTLDVMFMAHGTPLGGFGQ